MDATIAAGIAPLIWGVVALAIVAAGAIFAAVDPELVEVYVGDPPWVIVAVAFLLVLVLTVVTARPDLAHGITGLLSH